MSEVGKGASNAVEGGLDDVATKAKPYTNSRPSYGKEQVEEVWNNAKDPVTGKAYDPTVLKSNGILQSQGMVNGIWGIFQERSIRKCTKCIWMVK